MKEFRNSKKGKFKVLATAFIVILLSLFLFQYDGLFGDFLSFLGIAVIASSILYSIEVLSLHLYLDEEGITKKSLLSVFHIKFEEVDHAEIKTGGFRGVTTSSEIEFKLGEKVQSINLSYLLPLEKNEIIETVIDLCR